MKGYAWKNTLRIGISVAVLAIVCYLLIFSEPGVRLRHIDVLQWAHWLRTFGFFALLVGAAAIFVQTLFPIIPFVVVAGMNVLVFGFWKGFAINYSMSVAAALAAFMFARTVGREWVSRRFAEQEMIRKFNESATRQGFWYILVARLILILPSSVINVGSAVSGITFRQFALATLIGKLPIIYLESLIGHDLLFFKHNKERLSGLLLVFAALIGIGLWLRRKWMK